MERFNTKKDKPQEEELVIVYFADLTTVGKWSGRTWTILHEINNEDPISFGEVTPKEWSKLTD